nr:unnamed protein product [Callosobruchus chinensis]
MSQNVQTNIGPQIFHAREYKVDLSQNHQKCLIVVFISHLSDLFHRYLDIRAQYTQLVWAETYQIGCARIVFQGPESPSVSYREHFVCNYGPSGNIPGHPVYRIGEPCSQCPPGTGCTLDYPGLCGQEPSFNITYIKKTHRAVSAPVTPRSGSQVIRSSFLLCISIYFLIL